MNKAQIRATASSRGRFFNTGNGPALQSLDIGHPEYLALVEPDSAFWSLVKRDKLADILTDGRLLRAYRRKAAKFAEEMQMLRFGLKPSAVYFNATERCNLNCTYCYIPDKMRSSGRHMSAKRLLEALDKLHDYFKRTVSDGLLPQVIFHGAEPLLNRNAVFSGIERYGNRFRFGVQTNGTLLDDDAVEFLTSRQVSIGLSLDAPSAVAANRTRKNWSGNGVFQQVLDAMDRLRGYENWSVISTITSENLRHLTKLVEFLHARQVPTCLLNIVRCTLPGARAIRPTDASAAKHFLAALDRTYELYQDTGRKLPVTNFANILLAIVAPAARRLMCDISPCGGGRCFFALAPNGDMFPCSEFIGLKKFKGGNLFRNDVEDVLQTQAFRLVTERKVEDIDPCHRCAIRHFCGAPCPAEAHEMNGGMGQAGAFCEFYEEQVRYAFRLIADGKEEAYLWDGWDEDMKDTFDVSWLIAGMR